MQLNRMIIRVAHKTVLYTNGGEVMQCYLCGKGVGRSGNWLRFDFKRRWICYGCESSGRYSREQPDERDMCWRHNLPMRPAGGCIQCEKEGY